MLLSHNVLPNVLVEKLTFLQQQGFPNIDAAASFAAFNIF